MILLFGKLVTWYRGVVFLSTEMREVTRYVYVIANPFDPSRCLRASRFRVNSVKQSRRGETYILLDCRGLIALAMTVFFSAPWMVSSCRSS